MNIYYPDNWVVLKVTVDAKPMYKVLAGWSGGYTSGSSWRMNSGIVRAEHKDDGWLFYGASGSCYNCHDEAYRLRMNTSGVYNELMEQHSDKIELMPENTDWAALEYE